MMPHSRNLKEKSSSYNFQVIFLFWLVLIFVEKGIKLLCIVTGYAHVMRESPCH